MGAKLFKKQTVVWKLNGKKVRPRTPGAEKVTIESAKWYGTLNGEQVPLCRDKQAAGRMLLKLEADAALASVGLADPFIEHRSRALSEHLKDFAEQVIAARCALPALGSAHPQTLISRQLLAKVLGRLGRHDDALAEIDQVIAVQEINPAIGPDHPNTRASRSLRADMLQSHGRS